MRVGKNIWQISKWGAYITVT